MVGGGKWRSARIALTFLLKGSFIATIAAALTSGMGMSRADEPAEGDEAADYPRFEIEVSGKFQSNDTYKSKTRGAKVRDTYNDTDFNLSLYFNEDVWGRSHLKVDRVRSKADNEDRFFEDHALFVEEADLNIQRGWFHLYVGKFNPKFGIAWDRAPGFFGNDVAEDAYELKEGIGVGADATIEDEQAGKITFGVAAFFFDNTWLSSSVMSHPKPSDRRFGSGEKDIERFGRNRHRYGGSGNTHGPSSLAVTVDGVDIAVLPGLSYHLGFVRIDQGEDVERPQYFYGIGLEYQAQLTESVSLRPLVEYVYRRNVNGNPIELDDTAGRKVARRQNAHYITAGFDLGYQNWTASFSFTGTRFEEPSDGSGPNGRDANERLYSVALGYRFDIGIGMHLGWKREDLLDADRGSRVNNDTYGVQLSYKFGFAY